MKCCYSAFNAQGSRVIIVGVEVGAVKALRKKERLDKTQFTTKIDGFSNFPPTHLFECNCTFFAG
jgi:hypothetical protein